MASSQTLGPVSAPLGAPGWRDDAMAEAELVIVGAGPAGLASAIEARKQGVSRVVVMEKRGPDRTRLQPLALFRDNLDNLAHWGIDVTSRRLIVIIAEQRGYVERPAGTPSGAGVEGLNAESPVGFACIGQLESELADAARGLGGIELIHQHEVVGVERRGDRIFTRARSRHGHERTVTSRYLVVADGAQSATVTLLGLRRRAKGFCARLVGGVFRRRGYGVWTTVRHEGGLIVREGSKYESVLAEVPRHLTFRAAADRELWYRDRAARVGLEGDLLSPPKEIDVRLQSVDPCTVGDRVFVIGDAARTTHPWTGDGGNFALRDAARVGKLIGKLRETGERSEHRRLVERFAHETTHATALTHEHSASYFGTAPS